MRGKPTYCNIVAWDVKKVKEVCPICGKHVKWNRWTLDSCTYENPFVHTCTYGTKVKVYLNREKYSENIRFEVELCKIHHFGYDENDLSFAGSEEGVPVLKFSQLYYHNKNEECCKWCKKFKSCIFQKRFEELDRGLSIIKMEFMLEFEMTEYEKAREGWYESNWRGGLWSTSGDCIAKIMPKSIWNYKSSSWDVWRGGLLELYSLKTFSNFFGQKVMFLVHNKRRPAESADIAIQYDFLASAETSICPMLSISASRLISLECAPNGPRFDFIVKSLGKSWKCEDCYGRCDLKQRMDKHIELRHTLFGTALTYRLLLDKEEHRKLYKDWKLSFK